MMQTERDSQTLQETEEWNLEVPLHTGVLFFDESQLSLNIFIMQVLSVVLDAKFSWEKPKTNQKGLNCTVGDIPCIERTLV